MNAPVALAAFAPARRKTDPRTPERIFWCLAAVFLGGAALNAALGHWQNQPNRDLYQHLAALRVLIADLWHPDNPFVVTTEGSRHFHPYWVAVAAIARLLHLTPSQGIGVASFVSMGILAIAVRRFALAYFRSEWGPAALLLAMLAGWWLPISHTGFHSLPTLIEGAGYPAALLIGLSLLLWAWTIESLEGRAQGLAISALVAFMFATHQLGAGIGFIVAASVIALWPTGSFRRRVELCCWIGLGLAASALWPYHNPWSTLLAAGNPHWEGTPDFFNWRWLVGIFLPAIFGVLGLIRPVRRGTGWCLLAPLAIFLAGFVASRFGFLTGIRFSAPAALLLQIGLAAPLVRWWSRPEGTRKELALFAFWTATISLQVGFLYLYYNWEARAERRFGSVSQAALRLTSDIPDSQQVACYDVSAWPVAALGQKVLSIPWPEPLISDLDQRQAQTRALFDPEISMAERRRLAAKDGVRTLLLDWRFNPRSNKPWTAEQLRKLGAGARSVSQAGPMVRIDL